MQDLARGDGDRGAVVVEDVALDHGGGGVPGHGPQGGEVGAQRQVAVAVLPGGDLVAVDGVHVDVDGEQVAAALSGAGHHVGEEVLGGQALALEAALHVGHGEHDGVDGPVGDAGAQFVEGEPGAGHRTSSSVSCASGPGGVSPASVPAGRGWTWGPVNQCRAETSHHTPAKPTTTATATGV